MVETPTISILHKSVCPSFCLRRWDCADASDRGQGRAAGREAAAELGWACVAWWVNYFVGHKARFLDQGHGHQRGVAVLGVMVGFSEAVVMTGVVTL
jgi:hypothetical protein